MVALRLRDASRVAQILVAFEALVAIHAAEVPEVAAPVRRHLVALERLVARLTDKDHHGRC